MTFSERYNTLVVKPEKFFLNLYPFRHNERKRDGWSEKMTEISMFFGRCDLVFELFKNRSRLFKSYARRHVCAKFSENRYRGD